MSINIIQSSFYSFWTWIWRSHNGSCSCLGDYWLRWFVVAKLSLCGNWVTSLLVVSGWLALLCGCIVVTCGNKEFDLSQLSVYDEEWGSCGSLYAVTSVLHRALSWLNCAVYRSRQCVFLQPVLMGLLHTSHNVQPGIARMLHKVCRTDRGLAG